MSESLAPLFGGVLIGLAASLLLLSLGRIAGVSGIFGGILSKSGEDKAWRVCFILGLLGGGMLLHFFLPQSLSPHGETSLEWLAISGFLVGIGASTSNGCTSGHGVCGLARFSIRSLVAVAVFMTTAMLTVFFKGKAGL